MGNICCQILLSSLIVLDLRDVINDDDIQFFVAEKLRIRLGRSSYDLYLIDPSVVDIVDPYEVDAVLKT